MYEGTATLVWKGSMTTPFTQSCLQELPQSKKAAGNRLPQQLCDPHPHPEACLVQMLSLIIQGSVLEHNLVTDIHTMLKRGQPLPLVLRQMVPKKAGGWLLGRNTQKSTRQRLQSVIKIQLCMKISQPSLSQGNKPF